MLCWMPRPILAGLLLTLLAGCASLDPQPDWEDVQGLVARGTGVTPRWDRTASDAQAARARTEALVADGLSRLEAMEIALSNEPGLQARFDTLGVARANYVQAGLLTNPELGAYLGFPLRFDGSAIAILAMISDLWIVPAREAVAETELEQAVYGAAAAAVDTALAAEMAYDGLLYRRQLVDLEERYLALRRTALEHESRQPAPRTRRDSVVRESASAAALASQEIAIAKARRDLVQARNALQQLLQLPDGGAGVSLSDGLEEPAGPLLEEGNATAFALDRRIDLALGRLRVEEARRSSTLVKRGILGQVGAGPAYNGGFGSSDNWGPSASLTLPVFDQGQAGLAAAAFLEQKARHELAALEAATRREVADAVAEHNFQQQAADVLEQEVRPARERLIQASRPGSDRDLAEFLHWMKAQEDAISAERAYVTAVYRLRRSHTHLQRALFLGGGSDAGDDGDDAGGGDDGD